MKKAIIIFFVSAILIALNYASKPDKYSSTEEMLAKGLAYSGAKIIEGTVSFSSAIGDSINDMDELREKAVRIAEGFLQQKHFESLKADSSDILRKVSISEFGSKGEIIEVKAISKNIDGKWLSDIYADVTMYSNFTDTEMVKEKAYAAFNGINALPYVNACITGVLDGQLNEKKTDLIGGMILKNTNARGIERVSYKSGLVISAYSPVIHDVIDDSGEKNLNITIRYNPQEEKTYIRLATS